MSDHDADERVLAHFDRRAATYDDWWLGTGAFASPDRPGWSAEVEQLIGVVQALPAAHVVDIACGTGFLTRHLRGEVVALDGSARMVEVAAARLPHARVLKAEVPPLPFRDGELDRVFTSHFLHHLPPHTRASFVAEARRVAGELVVVEDLSHAGTAGEGPHEDDLYDGSAHATHRHSFTTAALLAELGGGRVLHEGRWFVVVAG